MINPRRALIRWPGEKAINSSWIDFHRIMHQQENCNPALICITPERDVIYYFFFDVKREDESLIIDSPEERIAAASGIMNGLRIYHPSIRFTLHPDQEDKSICDRIRSAYKARNLEEISKIQLYIAQETTPQLIEKRNDMLEFLY